MKLKTIYPVISLFMICVTITIALTVVNYFTKDRIALMREESINKSCMAVMPDAETFESDKEIYIARNSDGNIVGYIFITEAKGYADVISVMTGITVEGHITGIEILRSSETPGLGTKTGENWFKDMFITDYFPDKFELIKESVNGKQNKIESITGATKSSRAVTEAVNKAIDLYKDYK